MKHPVSWILQGTSPDMSPSKFSRTLSALGTSRGWDYQLKTWMATKARRSICVLHSEDPTFY